MHCSNSQFLLLNLFRSIHPFLVSAYLSIYQHFLFLLVNLFTRPYFHWSSLSINLSLLSIYLSIYFTYLSFYHSLFLSNLDVYPFIHLSITLLLYQSLSSHQSVCLSIKFMGLFIYPIIYRWDHLYIYLLTYTYIYLQINMQCFNSR